MKKPLARALISIALLFVLSSCNLPSPAATQAPLPPSPSPTSAPALPPKPNEYITVAQLNFWFRGSGCNGGFEAFDCSGQRNTALTPALGSTYDNASMSVIDRQIDWATAYGVDAFSIEWTTPRGVPGSLEEVLDDSFLKAPGLNKVRWCIFYDLVLRIQQTPGLKVDLSNGMNFDNPDVYNTFVDDFGHFADKYFGQDQYLKIDGRPVLYIWGTWNAKGRFVDAFKEARQKAASKGYDVYLVGDIILQKGFSPKLASVYDADTNFMFFTPDSDRTKDVGEAAVQLDAILTSWEAKISGLNVRDRQDKVIVQPGFAPQFDNRLFIQVNHDRSPIYIPATSKDQVTAMAEVVRKHAHPAAPSGLKLIWLNTWNNWPETTTFEPTAIQGPKYPAGNYQLDMVEVIRAVFGPELISGAQAPAAALAQLPLAPTPTATPQVRTALFSGTWEGTDPDDGSLMTMTISQSGNDLRATFKDTYSGNRPPPGFEGTGQGNASSDTSGQMTLHLTRHDGAEVYLGADLTLSNQNNTLTFDSGANHWVFTRK